MKSLKKTKKTALTIVTLSVVTSILFTAAAAEEIDFTSPVPADMPAAVTVIPAPAMITDGQPQSQTPAPDSSDTESDAGSDVTPQETEPDSISEVVTADTVVYDAALSTLLDTYSAADLMRAAGQTISEFSKQYDGFRYVYGAESPAYGFDCSGLVYYVYTHFGYALPRTASAQYKNGIAVETQDLTPGDLVFFATAGGRSVSHVGIYIGDGQFIHAATSQHGVIISRMDESYWAKAFIGAKRLVTSDSAFQLLCLPAYENML
jgi:cell wall-associated NlpC family hydrolase